MGGDESARLNPQLRINLRPLATPLPLGMYSFGLGMLLLAAQTAGWIPLSETKQVGMLLVSFVFPLEAVAAIVAFLARDTVAGTVLGLFATSWLALGLALIVGHPGATSITLGFFQLGFAAPILALAVTASAGKPLLSAIMIMSASRSILDGLYQVSSTTSLERAAGYVAAAIAAFALYAGTALVIEDVRQDPLLPVLRRGAGSVAMDGNLGDQLERAGGEAGVRQQL